MQRPRYQMTDVFFLFAFNVPMIEFTCMLWVIILHSLTQRFVPDGIVYRGSRSDSICFLPGANAKLSNLQMFPPNIHTITDHPLCFLLVSYKGLKIFHQLFIEQNIIIILSCHQHEYPWPFLAISPYRSPLPQVLWATPRILTELLYVGSSWSPRFARPCEVVHRSTSLMSSFLLLQQCPIRMVRLIWIVFVMGSRWPYNCWFVGVLPPGPVQYSS